MAQDSSNVCAKFFDVMDENCRDLFDDSAVDAYLELAHFKDLKRHNVTAREVREAWKMRDAKRRLLRPVAVLSDGRRLVYEMAEVAWGEKRCRGGNREGPSHPAVGTICNFSSGVQRRN